VNGDEVAEVRLAPESIEALATALAEALGEETKGSGTEGGPQIISAAEVAERWGVSRRWVYVHAEALGVRRPGRGRRPRLHFDPSEVAERLGVPRPAGAQSDRRRLTAMRANPHSDSLSG